MFTALALLVAAAAGTSNQGIGKLPHTAFQIVRPAPGHENLELVADGVRILESIGQPVSIVGVVGPYHSGKSFLLNALVNMWRSEIARASGAAATEDGEKAFLAPQNDLFSVAEKVAPSTMGLWALQTDIVLDDGSIVLFLDTEGFYGKDVSEEYDAKIFTVTTLLSSHLLYNSIKLVDQKSVEYLEILARRTQLFQIKNIIRATGSDPAEIVAAATEETSHVLQYNDFPPLTWVVEDFFQDLDGLTPDQWLDEYVRGRRDQSAKTRNITLYNLFTRGIHCQTIFLPSAARNDLEHLGRVDMNSMTGEFVSDVRDLQQRIAGTLRGKEVDGARMTGKGVAMLLRFILEHVDVDEFPRVPSLWNNWVDELVRHSHKDIEQFYDERIRRFIAATPPHNGTELAERHNFIAAQAVKFYKSMLFDEERLYSGGLRVLEQLLAARYIQYETENIKHIEAHIRGTVALFRGEVHREAVEMVAVPSDPQRIEEAREAANFRWITRFHAEFSRYQEGGDLYQTARRQFLDTVDAEYAARIQANDEFMGDLLKKSLGACSAAYAQKTAAMQAEDTAAAAHTLAELETASQAGELACDGAIDRHVQETLGADDGAAAVTWVRSMPSYGKFLAAVAETKQGIQAAMSRRNGERVQKVVDQAAASTIAAAAEQALAITPFPDQEDYIQAKLLKAGEQLAAEFAGAMGRYEGFSVYAEARQQLARELHRIIVDTLDRNVDVCKTAARAPLKRAKAHLSQEFDCVLCWTNLVVWMHDRRAFDIADTYLREDDKARKFGPELRHKVIQKWIEENLARERGAVLLHMVGLLLGIIVCGLAGLLLYIRRKRWLAMEEARRRAKKRM